MKSLCAPRGADGLAQLVYYNPGVGTQFGSRLRGGMFGYGLDQVVIDAYEWLIDHYEDGDEIFIFGFSRGAYSARSLAGLVAKCGLLRPGAPLGVKQIYGRYRLGSEARTLWALYAEAQAGTAGALSIEEEWMLKYSLRVPITLVGVWDTVGALGIPAFHIAGISRSTFGFLHTGLRLPIQHGFHALAVNEYRAAFDQGLIDQYGLRSEPPVQAHEFTNPTSAAIAAQLLLQRRAYIRNSYKFKLGWRYALLEPMDIVLLTDATLGLVGKAVRVTAVEEDDNGELTITADEIPELTP